ncbi:MAG: DUF4365 domain-containing protein [Clostridiales bacterium]|nr:DUF4365 domain-containing protein [Clostridiales bacterium]
MPNLYWDKLNPLQVGKYAEYYAKMEFASYGFDVYTSEVDDKGIDFIVKSSKGIFYEVQVKSLRNGGYIFIPKDKMDIHNERFLVCFISFVNSEFPTVYLIPTGAWKKPNAAFVSRDYEKEGQKSKPEWGMNFSNKNKKILDEYKIEQSIKSLL